MDNNERIKNTRDDLKNIVSMINDGCFRLSLFMLSHVGDPYFETKEGKVVRGLCARLVKMMNMTNIALIGDFVSDEELERIHKEREEKTEPKEETKNVPMFSMEGLLMSVLGNNEPETHGNEEEP